MPSQIPTKLSNYVLHLKNTSAISQVLRKKLNSFYSLCPLFLKDKCISSLFSMNYIEKKFNLQLFFLPTVSGTFILSRAITCYPPPRTFLFRKNNCICNQDNACDVAACPDE